MAAARPSYHAAQGRQSLPPKTPKRPKGIRKYNDAWRALTPAQKKAQAAQWRAVQPIIRRPSSKPRARSQARAQADRAFQQDRAELLAPPVIPVRRPRPRAAPPAGLSLPHFNPEEKAHPAGVARFFDKHPRAVDGKSRQEKPQEDHLLKFV